MTLSDSGAPDYEFDVAVSFAGDDRDYVEEVVEGVKAAGHSVFYDVDFQVEMWGRDGNEYLSDLYQNRARFVVTFSSAAYAERMWTNLERRASLARAMTQRTEYILPVTLDGTKLDGLLPTVIYVDARRTGLSGLIEAIKMKLGATPLAPIGRPQPAAPSTAEEIQAMIQERPPHWEWLLFGGGLQVGMGALEGRYRDHLIEYAPLSGEHLSDGEQVRQVFLRSTGKVQGIIANFQAVLDPAVQEAAFGAPGDPGDPERILHLAQRYVSVYEDLMGWATALRGASAFGEHGRKALRALARVINQPVESVRKFADDLLQTVNTFDSIEPGGDPVIFSLEITFELDEELMGEAMAELQLALAED